MLTDVYGKDMKALDCGAIVEDLQGSCDAGGSQWGDFYRVKFDHKKQVVCVPGWYLKDEV
jgi:hypothetical protein